MWPSWWKFFARRIVVWPESTSMNTDFVPDAREEVLYEPQPNPSL